MSSDGAGSTLIAFGRSRFQESETYYDSERLRVRFISNPCTVSETPVVCTETEECMTAGACNPVDLTCVGQAPKPDGTVCFEGLCVGGTCVSDPALSSSGSNQPSSAAGGLSGGADPAGCGCHAVGLSSNRDPLAIALAWLTFGLARFRARRSSSRARRAAHGPLGGSNARLSAPSPAFDRRTDTACRAQ
jgi:hypothetical protein